MNSPPADEHVSDIINEQPVTIPGGMGGTLTPWRKGQSGNPAGMTMARREAHRLAREASPAAVRVLIETMQNKAEETRARIVAATALLDRGLGKPRDLPNEKDDWSDLDLSHLMPNEVNELAVALEVINRLTGRGLAPVPLVQIFLPNNGRDEMA